jgi:hypothetical protein
MAEIMGSPRVTRPQRTAEQVQCGEWAVEQIVDHKDIPIEKANGKQKAKGKKKKKNKDVEMERHYRVRFEGYGEEDDLWYTDDGLRGEGLEDMMEQYDVKQREEDARRYLAIQPPPGDGVKRSSRLAAKESGRR